MTGPVLLKAERDPIIRELQGQCTSNRESIQGINYSKIEPQPKWGSVKKPNLEGIRHKTQKEPEVALFQSSHHIQWLDRLLELSLKRKYPESYKREGSYPQTREFSTTLRNLPGVLFKFTDSETCRLGTQEQTYHQNTINFRYLTTKVTSTESSLRSLANVHM